MSLKHVLVVVTNTALIGPNNRPTGYFFPEVAHPWEVFEKAGIALEYASPLGGSPHEDGYDEKDAGQRAFRASKAIRRMTRSRKLSEVDVLDYDALFFPGGLGPMVDIATDPEVKRTVIRAWNAGMIVSAVCHGPAAFLGARLEDGTPLVKGHKLTSFTNAEERGYADADVPFHLQTALVDEGAQFEETAIWQPKVVVDGRLITGQNPASAGPMAQAVVEAMRKGA
jgi:putative intracellular protease/amidase